MTQTDQMLKRVGTRQKLSLFGRRFYVSFLVLAGVYAVVLLASRFTGKIPDRFEPYTLLAIPAGALLLGFFLFRRPTDAELARLVDQRSGTKDLYLTTVLLEQSPGEYKPLVANEAEKKAAAIMPDSVVPFDWQRGALQSAIVIGVLLAAMLWMPQFDPFGDVQAAKVEETRKQDLKKSRKATKLRTAQLKKKGEGLSEESEEVKKAIESLKGDFKKSKKQDREGNSKRLAVQQKKLGEKWRKLNAKKLNELFNNSSDSNQRFGGMQKDKLTKWSRELQEGSTESLKKEIDAIKAELQKLAKTTDPVKKAELREKIKQRLKDLEELALNKLDSKPLAAAVKRAMKQLESSKREGSLDGIVGGAVRIDGFDENGTATDRPISKGSAGIGKSVGGDPTSQEDQRQGRVGRRRHG